MQRSRRDSQVVNNFFTFASIAILSITITIYTNYITKDEEKKVEPLPCQKEVLTKVKVDNRKVLKKSIKALNKGYYRVDTAILKRQNSSSDIEKVISSNELKTYYEELIKVPPKKDIEKYLKIKVDLIENEKDNINLSAGKIISSFRINQAELLRFESDIKFMYKNAIKNRVDCSMKVYRNYVEK